MSAAVPARKTCPVCGARFAARARQVYDSRVCGQKAARDRQAAERQATWPERYQRHLKQGGSSTPLL
jgi:hypothetical protein